MRRHRLAALRRSRGFSQESLAHRIGVERTTVGRWERGEAMPFPHQLPRLAKALGLSAAELDVLLGPEPGEPPTTVDDRGSRDEVEPWELVDSLTRSSIDVTAAAAMEHTIYRYAAMYPAMSPAMMSPLVHRQLARIQNALAGSQPLAIRRHLVRLLGYACGLAANLAHDTRQAALADEFFEVAAYASHEAADMDLVAWVAANRAIARYVDGAWRAARGLLDEAADHARSDSGPRRRAWIFALQARSAAAQHDERGAISLLAESESTLAATEDPVSGTDFFDAARLQGFRGTSLLRLGRLDQAGAVLAAAIESRPATELKGRALLMLDLAHCRLLQDEHEEAVRLVVESLDAASDSLVQPIVSRATELVDAIRSLRSADLPTSMSDNLAYIETKALEGPS